MVESTGPSGPSNHYQKDASDDRAAAAAGSLAYASRTAQAQLDGHAPALISRTIDLALRGNIVALRICMERILPPRKDRAVSFDSPAVQSAADAEQLIGLVTRAMARGDVTPREAHEIARTIEIYLETEFAARMEREVAELRKSLGENQSSELGRGR